MPTSTSIETTLLPGARTLLSVHARELPQRDDLCGAFCGALALRAAGIEQAGGEPVDQDAVALAAGSVVSRVADTDILPFGEGGRRDYRLSLPLIDDGSRSGTTAAGLVAGIESVSGARLVAIPYAGPWTAGTLGGLFDALAALERAATLVANFASRHLWGGHARADQLLDYLVEGELAGPPPDWDVGHFACVFGRARGPGGSLYGVADTYPSIGNGGVHVQPQERLAAAVERRDMPEGGMLAVVFADDAPAVRAAAGSLGLDEGTWDNGTVTPGAGAVARETSR